MNPDQEYWYAMRVTYGRELKVQAALDNKFKTYVPKCYKTVNRFGHRHYEIAAQVSNLIFVYASFNSIQEEKKKDTAAQYLRYIKKRDNDYLTIPNKQMEDFMRVSELPEEKLIPIDIKEGTKLNGQKVRIIEGELAGVEGRIMRLQGNKKVVVNIEDLMAVAISFIPPAWLTKLDEF